MDLDRRFLSLFNAIILLCITTSAYAAEDCLVQARAARGSFDEGPIATTIESPIPDTIQRERSFRLILNMTGDLSGLDHVHYGTSLRTSTSARDALETAEDASGIIDITIESSAPDGDYEVCAYPADHDHFQLGAMVCVPFVLKTTEIIINSPAEGEIFNTFDIPLDLSPYGERDISFISFKIGSFAAGEIPTYIGRSVIEGIPNGQHSLYVEGLDSELQSTGVVANTNFLVDSMLNIENAKRLFVLARRILKRRVKRSKRTRLLNELILILDSMKDGGKANPEYPNLTSSAIVELTVKVTALIERKKPKRQKLIRLKRKLKKLRIKNK